MTVTKDQFEADPRAKRIRFLCLDIVRALGHASGNPSQRRGVIRARITEMKSLGIVADIHTGKPPETFTDPVTLAEFVAGQILTELEGSDEDIDSLVSLNITTNATCRLLDAQQGKRHG